MDYGGQADTPATWRSPIKREQTAFVLAEFLLDVNQITNQPSLHHPIPWNCFVFENGRQTRQFIRRITRSICRSRTFRNADVPLQFVPLAFVIDDTAVVIQRFRHVSKYSIRSRYFFYLCSIKFKKKRTSKKKRGGDYLRKLNESSIIFNGIININVNINIKNKNTRN